MARAAEWVFTLKRGKWCASYKRVLIIVCSINVVVALYFLQMLCTSLHIYSGDDSHIAVKYTPEQITKMAESVRIRRASEPLELINLVKELNKEFSKEEMVTLPPPIKQKIIDEILQRLRNLNTSATANEKRDAVERWRTEKLEEFKLSSSGNGLGNSTFLPEEAGILVEALESNWALVWEEIGLWIPTEIVHNVHDDAPEGEQEFDEDIIPGRPPLPECRAEIHTDYGGIAVRWGLTHHKESAADCCQACLDQAKYAKPSEQKCNIWVYCPSEYGCHSPDIYEHKNQECWLKFAERPTVNFKDKYSESYRNSHPTAPLVVPWVSGVVSR